MSLHIKRPCDECPWRIDAEPGRFEAERWEALAASSHDGHFGPQITDPMFACHKTPDGKERACAGWLAVEGANHPRIRLGVMTGEVPECALSPQEGWPALHPDFATTRAHDEQETP